MNIYEKNNKIAIASDINSASAFKDESTNKDSLLNTDLQKTIFIHNLIAQKNVLANISNKSENTLRSPKSLKKSHLHVKAESKLLLSRKRNKEEVLNPFHQINCSKSRRNLMMILNNHNNTNISNIPTNNLSTAKANYNNKLNKTNADTKLNDKFNNVMVFDANEELVDILENPFCDDKKTFQKTYSALTGKSFENKKSAENLSRYNCNMKTNKKTLHFKTLLDFEIFQYYEKTFNLLENPESVYFCVYPSCQNKFQTYEKWLMHHISHCGSN